MCYILQVTSNVLPVRQIWSLEMKSTRWITGLVVEKVYLVVMHAGDKSLYVYKSEGRTVSEHSVSSLISPGHMVGLVNSDKNHLVISDSSNRMLHWVSLFAEGGEVKSVSVKNIKVDYMPLGMCVNSSGEVVVCSPHTNRLYKYSSDGQCLGHIQLSSEVEPWFITSLSASDGYVISDRRHRQIMWIREDGTSLRGVQQGEVRPGIYLDGPQDLIHDNDGHILVADDVGHQVLVFDQTGHCTGQLLSEHDENVWDDIKLPTTMLLDQVNARLYVSTRNPTRVIVYCYSS